MKKLLLVLLFVPLVSFGQTFGDGYRDGFREGYCLEQNPCSPPNRSVIPSPNYGYDKYSDGYQRGLIDGKAQKVNLTGYNSTANLATSPMPAGSGNTISSSYGTLSTSPVRSNGAYTNYDGGAAAEINAMKQKQESLNKMNESMANLTGSLIANMRKNVKNEILVPLKVDLNAFKYIVFNKVGPDAGKSATRTLIRKLKKNLTPLDYKVINLLAKKEEDNDPIPEDLKSDPSIGLYFTFKCTDDMQGVSAYLSIFDSNENLVFYKNTVGWMVSGVTKKIASELLANNHSYKPNIPKYLPVQLTEEDILVRKEKADIAKDEAVKRLKEAKDLFDSGILTKEEYDKLVAKYKPIIMGN